MNAGPARAPSFHLELPIGPEWKSIDRLHSTIARGAGAVPLDEQLCQTLAMVASELVENAVKYGDWSRAKMAALAVSPRATPAGDVIDIEVTNPIRSEAEHEAVQATLAWISGFASPREAYIARIRELAEEVEPEQNRLGLVRVAYEGGCQLEATLLPGRMLCVRATLLYVVAS